MKNITEAITKTMQNCGYISKDSTNTHHKYKYTSEAEIIGAIRAPMAQNGLSLLPVGVQVLECATSGKMYRYDLLVTYKLLHVSGESIDLVVPASGADTQDKALPKAMTMALKYALIQAFLVARGVDPDADGDIHESELASWARPFGGIKKIRGYCRRNEKPDPATWSDQTFANFEAALADGRIEL